MTTDPDFLLRIEGRETSGEPWHIAFARLETRNEGGGKKKKEREKKKGDDPWASRREPAEGKGKRGEKLRIVV